MMTLTIAVMPGSLQRDLNWRRFRKALWRKAGTNAQERLRSGYFGGFKSLPAIQLWPSVGVIEPGRESQSVTGRYGCTRDRLRFSVNLSASLCLSPLVDNAPRLTDTFTSSSSASRIALRR